MRRCRATRAAPSGRSVAPAPPRAAWRPDGSLRRGEGACARLQRANPVSCRLRRPKNGENACMKATAARVALATLVAVGIVVGLIALWKLKVLIALLFLAFIIAAAMRPSVEWLRRHRIPRGI